ncbi:MAG: polyisoprenyl-phosphate glycosyltransferase [Verrucomicrobiota bacterium]
MQTVSVIVPCFNEEQVLPQLFARLSAAAAAWKMDFEVICVDDGSRDSTWSLLKEQHRKDPRWRCLAFSRNFGHQTAVSAGLAHASGDVVAIMDADLQDPPEELGRFLEKWRDGYEVIYAIRQKRKEGPLKRFFYWSFYRLMALLVPFDLPLDSGDFCVMDRKLVEVLNSMPERNRFVRGLRAWAGFKQIGIAYERKERATGAPKYTLRKLIQLAWDGIFSFSTVPLTIVGCLGLVISTLSALGILFTLAQRIFARWFQKIGFGPVPGFATIVITILFLGGVQLLCIGVVGEYIGRIYDEVKRRPMWIVREACGLKAETTHQNPQ